MPNILFASNNIAHWPYSLSSTATGKFDATRVPYAIILSHEQQLTTPEFVPTSGDDTWIHFRSWFDTDEYVANTVLLSVFDTNSKLLFRLTGTSYTYDFAVSGVLYNGSTTANFGQSILFNPGYINGIDMKYTNTAGGMTVQFYVNGGLAGEATIGSNPNSYGPPAYFTIGSAFADVNEFQYFSEFIVADGDTRNARLNLLRPTASGGETDWVGAAVDLGDDDPTTGMTTLAAEQRQTVALSAYSGAANISSLVIATLSYAGANGPQNMRHTVRMSSVNYDSADDLPLNDTLKYHMTDYQINPGTSLPWVSGDLASLEIGFISKA